VPDLCLTGDHIVDKLSAMVYVHRNNNNNNIPTVCKAPSVTQWESVEEHLTTFKHASAKDVIHLSVTVWLVAWLSG